MTDLMPGRGLHVLLLALASLLVLTAVAAPPNPHSIVESKHNLSVSGKGTIRAATETEICVFCHAPHTSSAQTALWNHQVPAAAYTPYRSSTLKATVGQPTGASKLCLSCHDGTMAVGMLANHKQPVSMRNSTVALPSGSSRVGTDLSGHHPISFTYDSTLASAKGTLRDPLTLRREVRLDQNQQMQCTSCHDPHNDQYGKFLVKNNTGSALCLECHAPTQWSSSAHATSQATWNGTGRNPWPHSGGTTVAANGCENCHAPHDAGTKPHLLNYAKAEDNCLVCHNGTVAKSNVATEFNKPSAHPIMGLASARDATLGPMDALDQHVACVDCHDPHATRAGTSATSSVAIVPMKGVSAAGAVVDHMSHEYELCFRCHSSSSALASSKIARQFSQPNTRLQFDPANASYHPVLSTAKSVRDRTLVSPWSGASQIACTDCHNNDQGPAARGNGPNGPHGSRYVPLLERNLVRNDFQPESATAYALCYKCHSQAVLMADRLHGRHVRDQKTACTTCHDAHGVQNQPHLVNFSTLYVQPLKGQLRYFDRGAGRSTCTLICHGASHSSKGY